jgi:hypothetical protein
MKTWQTNYKGHQVRVENRWFSGEKLIVDGETQDEQNGFAMRSRLSGKIGNADGTAESIKVSLGGWFGISCRIFIDNKLVYSGT